jgi:uncharacterized membrane protein YjjP (DUF1212 family)
VRRVEHSGLPVFFQALVGPALATGLAILLVAIGAPIHGGLVVTGAILRFLPGAALVAGMRDLIDRSIISGTARLAEAILLGSAVAVGTAAAVRLATVLGGPDLKVGVVGTSLETVTAQAIAAGLSCSFFALRLGVSRLPLLGVFLLGAVAWAVSLQSSPASDLFLPVIAPAILVGVVGQLLALRARKPAVIWTVPAILPLLPGLTIVRGILGIGTVEGLITVASAIGIGLALGAGVAFGSILMTTALHAGEVAQAVVLPVLADARPPWVARARTLDDHSTGSPDEPPAQTIDVGPEASARPPGSP